VIQPDLLVIAPPSSRRVRALQASLKDCGLPEARVLSWTDVIAGVKLEDVGIREGTVVKIESPGEDWDTERALLELGYDAPDSEHDFERIHPARLEFDTGRIHPSRQWYLGFRQALHVIQTQLETLGRHAMNHPEDIAVMFDKRATHARLEAAGVRVPPSLGGVNNFEELVAGMRERGWHRVFVKLAHGSGAQGVIALETNRDRWLATSTVEMVGAADGSRLYNTRLMWRYTDLSSIRQLVNAVCRHRVHVERWLPKASFDDKNFDLRVVVIGGHARHVLVRRSSGPVTNLHLGNERGDWNLVRERLGDAWDDIRASCERSLETFSRSLYAGVDVLVQTDWKKHALLEVNAFGDYHRNVFVNGLDTYQTQLEALGHGVKRVERE
jgi:glutathione synthase/RimK-type ligase-like ATP-grasp enzyme